MSWPYMHILRKTITSNTSFDNHSKKVTTEIKMPSSSAQQQNNITIFFTIVRRTQESTAMENQYNKRKYLITNQKNWSVLKFVKVFKYITIMSKKKLSQPMSSMQTGRVMVQHHSFSALTLDGGEWSTSCPSSYIILNEPQYPQSRNFTLLWKGELNKNQKVCWKEMHLC